MKNNGLSAKLRKLHRERQSLLLRSDYRLSIDRKIREVEQEIIDTMVKEGADQDAISDCKTQFDEVWE
jgi:hypothetical protein